MSKISGNFCELYNNGGTSVWGRNQTNGYVNFSNNGGAAAVSSESLSGYYALRDDGYIYGSGGGTFRGSWGADAIDLMADHAGDIYTISSAVSVKRSLNGGSVTTSAGFKSGQISVIIVFNLASNSNWAGKTITGMRLDPVAAAGADFEVEPINAYA